MSNNQDGGLFGSGPVGSGGNTTSGAPSGGFFGTAPTPRPFGNTFGASAAGTSITPSTVGTATGIFGSGTSPGLPFGGGSNSASTPTSGAMSGSGSATPLFNPFNKLPTAPSASSSSGFTFGGPALPDAAAPTGDKPAMPIGDAAKPIASLFSMASTPQPTDKNTPTPQSSGGLFSTANAGSTPGPGLFGAKPTAPTTLFGNSATKLTESKPSGMFGTAGTTTSAPTATNSSNFFGGGATAASISSNKTSPFAPAVSTPSSMAPSAASTPPSLFGGAAGATAPKPFFGGTPAATSTPTNTTTPGPLFGGSNVPATPSTATVASSSLFGSAPVAGTDKTITASTTSATATPSLFPAARSPASAAFPPKPFPVPTPASALSPVTTTSAPTNPPLFDGKPVTSSPAATKPAAPAMAASTSSAPTNPAQSRLKNKSMEEIMSRWLNDTSKYKAQFFRQAEEIKKWDQLLIENGEKISKLYNDTTEEEKKQNRIDTQLSYLENEQNELSDILDHYENLVKELFEGQIGGTDGMQPADTEREGTYFLARRLNDYLEQMGKDLAAMIEEINKASETINKTTNQEDPLSQIVKVLNNHLSSLQWIDTHTTAIQEKIQEAQKEARGGSATGDRYSDDDFFARYASLRSSMR